MKSHMPFRRKRGSAMLETVIAFPVFLLLTLSILHTIVIGRADLILRNAADNATTEFGLFVTTVDAVQSSGLLSGGSIPGDYGEDLIERILDIGATMAGDAWIRDRILYWIQPDGNPDASLRCVSGLKVSLEGTLTDSEWFARVEYRAATLLGVLERSFASHVPIRSGFRECGGTEETDDTDGIWSLHNLERGKIFRIRNGGNLPMGYPVLSGFRNGTAFVIRSMDTTASGLQDDSVVYGALAEEIDGLAEFDGTARPWGKDGIWIRPEDIHSRHLLVVIPENPVSTLTDAGIGQASDYALSRGITLEVSRQGMVPETSVETG